MLAPIALYPDALLAQTLMAASYPLEVVEAARWSKDNPGLKGAAALAAVKDKGWDVSVTSLVAFPQVLAMMNSKLDWRRPSRASIRTKAGKKPTSRRPEAPPLAPARPVVHGPCSMRQFLPEAYASIVECW